MCTYIHTRTHILPREMVRGCCCYYYCCCCCWWWWWWWWWCWCVQSTLVEPRAVRSIEARGYYTFLGGGHPASPLSFSFSLSVSVFLYLCVCVCLSILRHPRVHHDMERLGGEPPSVRSPDQRVLRLFLPKGINRARTAIRVIRSRKRERERKRGMCVVLHADSSRWVLRLRGQDPGVFLLRVLTW